MRIQKWLAQQGIGSRREIETWIREGRLFVNGKAAELGQKMQGDERVDLDGKRLSLWKDDLPARTERSEGVPQGKAFRSALIRKERPEEALLGRTAPVDKERVLLYHKPVGEICTRHDPQGRNTVFEKLPALQGQRWISIGRLDIQTSGLLLFTTEGELAHRLMHPRYAVEREYAVRILGTVTSVMIDRVLQGVALTIPEGGQYTAKFGAVHLMGGEGANRWYRVLLREGKYREVRRLWESQGVKISRLKRIRMGPILLPKGLPEGKMQELSYEDKEALRALVGL